MYNLCITLCYELIDWLTLISICIKKASILSYEYCRMLIKQIVVYTVYTVYSMTPVCGWSMNLLHVNDIHVRMEETNKYSAGCRIEDKEFNRINTLYLNYLKINFYESYSRIFTVFILNPNFNSFLHNKNNCHRKKSEWIPFLYCIKNQK